MKRKNAQTIRWGPRVLAALVMMAFLLPVSVHAEDGPKTISYNANGGYFDQNESNTVNEVTYDGVREVTKYSYTQNLSEDGTQNGNYGNNWTEANIRGSDWTGGDSGLGSGAVVGEVIGPPQADAHVVTIQGSPSLTVTINYGGESTEWDWACVWAGAHPEYRASSDYGLSVSGKLGGDPRARLDMSVHTATYTIDGDSVTFGFHSNESGCGNGYGYYAVITGQEAQTTEGKYKKPTTNEEGFAFIGWNTEQDGQGTSVTGAGTDMPDGTTLYAQWSDAKHSGTCGGCSWKIRYDGKLLIYPTDGVSGTLDSNEFGWRSCWNSIQNVEIQSGVQASESCEYMFSNCSNITEIDLNNLDTSNTMYMSNMFAGCTKLHTVDLENLNTENVQGMSSMFYNCQNLRQVDISGWQTSNVTNMGYMFDNCSNLESVNMSGLDLSNVTDMGGMFTACNSLKQVDFSGVSIGDLTNMSYMFQNCSDLEHLDLSSFNTANVTNMRCMFQSCVSLSQLNLSSFDTSNVTDMWGMMQNCPKLKELDLSGFNTGNLRSASGILPESLKKATLGPYFFLGDIQLPEPELYVTTGKWTKEDGSSASYYPSEMRDNWNEDTSPGVWVWEPNPDAYGLTMIDRNKWLDATDSFRTFSMPMNMQPGETYDLRDHRAHTFTRSNIASESELPESAKRVDLMLSDYKIYTWEDDGTWYWWSDAATIYMPFDSLDLFSGAEQLKELDLTDIDSSKVVNASYMFAWCRNLEDLDLSQFDARHIQYMKGMFQNCCLLSELDLTNFDTTNVSSADELFGNCYRLTTLKLGPNFFMTQEPIAMPKAIAAGNLTTGKWVKLRSDPELAYDDTSMQLNWDPVQSPGTWQLQFVPEADGIALISIDAWRDFGQAYINNWVVKNTEIYYPQHVNGEISDDEMDTLYNSMCAGVTKFERSTLDESNLPMDAMRVDVGIPGGLVYTWIDGNTWYWWSNRDTVYTPVCAENMFDGQALPGLGLTSLDLSVFDASFTQSVNKVVLNCTHLADLNLSGWDFKCAEMIDMVVGDYMPSLESINLNNWTFNIQPDSALTVQRVIPLGNSANNEGTAAIKSITADGWTFAGELDNGNSNEPAGRISISKIAYADQLNGVQPLETIELNDWSFLGNIKIMQADACLMLNSTAIAADAVNANNWHVDILNNFVVSDVVSDVSNVKVVNANNWDLKAPHCKIENAFVSRCKGLETVNFNNWTVGDSSEDEIPIDFYTDAFVNLDDNVINEANANDWYFGKNVTFSNSVPQIINNSSNGAETLNVNGWQFDDTHVESLPADGIVANNIYQMKELNMRDWSGQINVSDSFHFGLIYSCNNLETLDMSGWSLTYTAPDNDLNDKLAQEPIIASYCDNLSYANISGFDLNWHPVDENSGIFDQSGRYGADLFCSCKNLSRITVGPTLFSGDVPIQFPEPDPEKTTGRWVMETDEDKAYSVEQLSKMDTGAELAGTWVWEMDNNKGTVIFNCNGGKFYDEHDGEKEFITRVVSVRKPIPMPANAVMGEGNEYHLSAWNTERDGSGTSYEPGTMVSNLLDPGETIALYAQWESGAENRSSYTIIHYRESTNPRMPWNSETEYVLVSPDQTVTAPTKNYLGYATPESQTVDIPEQPEGSMGPYNTGIQIEYYYYFETYTIAFNGNGATSGGMDDMEVHGRFSIPENRFERVGYRFSGWNTKQNGSGRKFVPGDEVMSLAETGDTFTLYAQWTQLRVASATDNTVIAEIKDKEKIVFPNLPSGVKYEIEEVDLPDGWTMEGIGQQSDSDDNIRYQFSYDSGHEFNTGTAYSADTRQHKVLNSYDATGTVNVVAHKKVEGKSLLPNQFTFELLKPTTVVAHSDNLTDAGTKTSNYATGLETNQVITIPGATSIRVKARVVTADSSDYACIWEGEHSEYTALDNPLQSHTGRMSGKWENEFVLDGDTVTIGFHTDAYEDSQNAYGYYIEVTGVNEESYTVAATAQNGPVDTTEELEDGSPNPWFGTAPVIFPAIEMNTIADQKVYVRESQDGEVDQDLDYDDHVQTVTVKSKDLGSGNASYTTQFKAGSDLFVNSVRRDQLSVNCVVQNATENAMRANLPFTLVVTDSDGIELEDEFKVSMPDGTTKKIHSGDKVQIKPSQNILIDGIPCTARYTITPEAKTGFTPESESISNQIRNTAVVTLNYTYDATGSVTITATKKYLNETTNQEMTIPADKFQFVLMESFVDGSTQELQRAYADEDGTVTFEPINYTLDDNGAIIMYTISEVAGDDANITWDDHTEQIQVSVRDNGNGVLSAPVSTDADGVVFVNTTSVSYASLTVQNEVTGTAGNMDKKFQFSIDLENTDITELSYTKDGESGTIPVSNNKASFELEHGQITFTEVPVGTRVTIAEQSDGYTVTVNGTEGDTEFTGTVNGDTTVTFGNRLDMTVPTSAFTDGKSGLIVIAIVSILAGFSFGFVLAKKKQKHRKNK